MVSNCVFARLNFADVNLECSYIVDYERASFSTNQKNPMTFKGDQVWTEDPDEWELVWQTKG